MTQDIRAWWGMVGARLKVLSLYAVVAWFVIVPVAAQQIPPPAAGQWAKYVIDNLDVVSFPTPLLPRSVEGKVTFADYGIKPTLISANSANLETQDKNDWDFYITVLSHDKQSILICWRDKAIRGTSGSSGPVHLVVSSDGKHLPGYALSVSRPDCEHFAH